MNERRKALLAVIVSALLLLAVLLLTPSANRDRDSSSPGNGDSTARNTVSEGAESRPSE